MLPKAWKLEESAVNNNEYISDDGCMYRNGMFYSNGKELLYFDLPELLLDEFELIMTDRTNGVYGGKSVVAKKDIPKDTVVGYYAGKFHHVFGSEPNPFMITIEEDDGNSTGLCVDAFSIGNITRYFNNSFETKWKPNVKAFRDTYLDFDNEIDRIGFVTIKDIKVGDEIFCSYAMKQFEGVEPVAELVAEVVIEEPVAVVNPKKRERVEEAKEPKSKAKAVKILKHQGKLERRYPRSTREHCLTITVDDMEYNVEKCKFVTDWKIWFNPCNMHPSMSLKQIHSQLKAGTATAHWYQYDDDNEKFVKLAGIKAGVINISEDEWVIGNEAKKGTTRMKPFFQGSVMPEKNGRLKLLPYILRVRDTQNVIYESDYIFMYSSCIMMGKKRVTDGEIDQCIIDQMPDIIKRHRKIED